MVRSTIVIFKVANSTVVETKTNCEIFINQSSLLFCFFPQFLNGRQKSDAVPFRAALERSTATS